MVVVVVVVVVAGAPQGLLLLEVAVAGRVGLLAAGVG